MTELAKRSTKISNWATDLILAEKTAIERRRVIGKLIEVADLCCHNKNYLGIFQIVSALRSPAVYRLKQVCPPRGAVGLGGWVGWRARWLMALPVDVGGARLERNRAVQVPGEDQHGPRGQPLVVPHPARQHRQGRAPRRLFARRVQPQERVPTHPDDLPARHYLRRGGQRGAAAVVDRP